VMSDHGQITAKTNVDIKQNMADNGLVFDQHFAGIADYAGSAGYYGAIRIRDGDSKRMASLVDWFADQPWQGHVFTPNGNGIDGSVAGTFDRALLNVAHARAPEVYFTLRTDNSENQWGMPGACYFSSTAVPEGGGTHGGLHPIEMNNVLGAQGSLFKETFASAWPASHTDIAPTILNAFGIAPPTTMTGRLLVEALLAGKGEPPEPETFECTVERKSGSQSLQYWRVGTSTYLDHGWIA
jgi:hypothetical protein